MFMILKREMIIFIRNPKRLLDWNQIPNKFKTPAPNAYDSEKSEDYLEGGIKLSFGLKPEIKNKFKTPAPNAYDTEKGEDYLDVTVKQLTMGERLKEAKKFLTPAPNKYEVKIEETVKDEPSFAFGVKHSPYLYNGRELGRERWVSTKTEMVNGDSAWTGESSDREVGLLQETSPRFLAQQHK